MSSAENRENVHGHAGNRAAPVRWVLAAAAGFGLGALWAWLKPAHEIGLVHCIPFALLLASIALAPFVAPRLWHQHYPEAALGLGGLVLGYFIAGLGGHGVHAALHSGREYFSFIALVCGLYVVSGGILIDVHARGTPARNAALLAAGALLANLVGTTGASVLLIRPFMRMNRGRLRPVHVVFFIFIVSNCGGCLTPIGDPPLYLGYLAGVPFFWTLTNLWPAWLLVNGTLLGVFVLVDRRIPAGTADADVAAPGVSRRELLVQCWPGVLGLLLLVGGVFIDPVLERRFGFTGWPVGAAFQVVVAAASYMLTRPSLRRANHFSFAPAKEVAFLFAGIFLTMMPALEYLREHAQSFPLRSPGQFYFASGVLSSMLDNAPTYLSFLQVELGLIDEPMNPVGLAHLLEYHGQSLLTGRGVELLEAVSLGSVFFGAMTYIGNGPNFMVKAIVDETHARGTREGAAPGEKSLGVKMPSFFGYTLYAAVLLLPVLVLAWWVFLA